MNELEQQHLELLAALRDLAAHYQERLEDFVLALNDSGGGRGPSFQRLADHLGVSKHTIETWIKHARARREQP